MCFAISPTHHAFTEVHSRLGDDFDSGFLQIPHWLNNMFTSAAAASHLVSSETPLPLSIHSLLYGLSSNLHRLVIIHAERTKTAICCLFL